MSGRTPASSHASSELSTASLIVVSRAFCGLSKPSKWRFFAKNSEIEISRCAEAIWSAVRCFDFTKMYFSFVFYHFGEFISLFLGFVAQNRLFSHSLL